MGPIRMPFYSKGGKHGDHHIMKYIPRGMHKRANESYQVAQVIPRERWNYTPALPLTDRRPDMIVSVALEVLQDPMIKKTSVQIRM